MSVLPISNGKPFIENDDIREVIKSLKSGFLSQGDSISQFEELFKKKFKCKFSIACNSGTSAIYLAMHSINVKKNDSIILPSINFIAAANVANLFEAKIYFADVDIHTGQVSVETVLKCIKKNKIKKVKAIVNMYLSGNLRQILNFYKLKKKLNCYLIEDACHALGSYYYHKKKKFFIGSCEHSDICTFSFHPLKTITTGEGGLISTNNKKIYERSKLFRSHGIIKTDKHYKYNVTSPGLNLRLSNINASLGISQFKKIDKFTLKRKKIFDFYYNNLDGYKNIIKISQTEKNTFSSNHLVIANFNFLKLKINKDNFIKILLRDKIVIHYHYIPNINFKCYKSNDISNFKGALSHFKNAISLPIYYKLSITELKKVEKKIKSVVDRYIL